MPQSEKWHSSSEASHCTTHLLPPCPTTAALETSRPSPLGDTCATQDLSAAHLTPTTCSAALTSSLPAHTSWAPPSPVAVKRPAVSPPAAGRPTWCPDLASHPATPRGPPHSSVPARQLIQGLWALAPAAFNLLVVALPLWALDWVVSSQWAVVPVPFHPWVVDPAFTVHSTTLLEAASLLSANQPVGLASTNLMLEHNTYYV